MTGTIMAAFRVYTFWYLFDLRAIGKIGITLLFAAPLYCPELLLMPGDPFVEEGRAHAFSWVLVAGSYVIAGIVALLLDWLPRKVAHR